MKKVFYSWQSDYNPSRNVIAEALKSSSKGIDGKKEFLVDEATNNRVGAPAIADTILEKINESDIFVCDISIINSNQDEVRKTPNPNVLIELGYAARALGWGRIICLFDESTGDKEDLPFDVRHRRIVGIRKTESESNKTHIERISQMLKIFISQISQKASNLNLILKPNLRFKTEDNAVVLKVDKYKKLSEDEIIRLVDLKSLGVNEIIGNAKGFMQRIKSARWDIPKSHNEWVRELIEKKIEHIERDEEIKKNGYSLTSKVKLPTINEMYIEDYVNYVCNLKNTGSLDFRLLNNSEIALTNLKIEFNFPKDSDVKIFNKKSLPSIPTRYTQLSVSVKPFSMFEYKSSAVDETYTAMIDVLNIGECYDLAESIYMICSNEKTYEFTAKIFSGQFTPIEFSFNVFIDVKVCDLMIEHLLEM